MEPRRNRRRAATPGSRRAANPGGRPRTRRRFRFRAPALLIALVAAAAPVLVWRAARGHKAPAVHQPAPPPGASSSAAGASQHTPTWQTWRAPGGGGVPAVTTGAASDPDGTLWLVAVAGGGTPYLIHVSTSGDLGQWPLAFAKGTGVHIQTVGADKVWLATGTQERSFDKASAAFQSYSGQPALAAATVSGYSVGVYVPRTAKGAVSGPPYVLVAPLGATHAQEVTLPQAITPVATPPAEVLAGPAGQALVLVGSRVWSVSPQDHSAAVWATLPSGADPASGAWGSDRLWVVTPQGVSALAPGGAPTTLGASRTHPPSAETGLTYSGGRLWWLGSDAVYADEGASGAVARYPYPTSGTGVLAAAPDGSVWAAVGDRYALLETGNSG